ncbi:uncharacterized protein LOC111875657 [Cryptotermes secundus]|uniref:uncharacterized protein LOC111875657 n=1 Tax=Cryptotermes secundus TaxID=105785 RepID=UPI000CD7C6D7|nr:uncharacterized protein LOC111875657 [Cryptotermes secundus]
MNIYTVVTMLYLLNAASVLSLPTVLPEADLPNTGVESKNINEPALPNAGLQSEETNGPVAESDSTDKPVLFVGAVGSEDEDEPVVVDVDDILEVAEILVFRPSYKYWQNCIERRHKQAHREYSKHQ